MRFEEAYSGWTERRLTQEDAAQLLGVCARTFRRYIDRYEEDGLDGLLDKRLTQVSHRRAPVDEVLRLVDRYRRRHDGWNVKHYYSWYRRDGGTLNGTGWNWTRCGTIPERCNRDRFSMQPTPTSDPSTGVAEK